VPRLDGGFGLEKNLMSVWGGSGGRFRGRRFIHPNTRTVSDGQRIEEDLLNF
jgi:hypothetical protein